jgi:hypothetical protein
MLSVAPLLAARGDATSSVQGITPAPAKSDVATHEITTATVRGVGLTAETYAGSIGDAPIVAGRVNDSTLASPFAAGIAAAQQSVTRAAAGRGR